MIAGALSFNSGILLFADTEPIVPRRIPHESTTIFHREYGSSLGVAHSVFVVSESVDWARAACQRCERALDGVRPAERTIDRMRETIEQSLGEGCREQDDGEPAERELPLFVVLYSPCLARYSLFRAIGATLREVAGYDCQGAAVYLGHYFIRDRYNAARSLDELDLTTVFSIAVDTLGGIRERHDRCGESGEVVVVYADGHVSDIQPIPHDSQRQRAVTLARLAHS
jgi:prepilin-type processing-associated H-X9-DG protein